MSAAYAAAGRRHLPQRRLWTTHDDARPCGQGRAISRYAAWSRRGSGGGQAAEPSADFDELEPADAVLDEPPDEPDEEPDEPDEEPDEPVELDEPESLEPLADGTEAEELLRESVR
jgi:hypothetical protein